MPRFRATGNSLQDQSARPSNLWIRCMEIMVVLRIVQVDFEDEVFPSLFPTSCVCSVLTYFIVAGSARLTKRFTGVWPQASHVKKFHMRRLRSIMNIHWQERVANLEVLDRAEMTWASRHDPESPAPLGRTRDPDGWLQTVPTNLPKLLFSVHFDLFVVRWERTRTETIFAFVDDASQTCPRTKATGDRSNGKA